MTRLPLIIQQVELSAESKAAIEDIQRQFNVLNSSLTDGPLTSAAGPCSPDPPSSQRSGPCSASLKPTGLGEGVAPPEREATLVDADDALNAVFADTMTSLLQYVDLLPGGYYTISQQTFDRITRLLGVPPQKLTSVNCGNGVYFAPRKPSAVHDDDCECFDCFIAGSESRSAQMEAQQIWGDD